ncbi:MAG: hypothetical protein FGM61_09090 [Sediminibacterium sp.]|nr:hypothetical protein [Sediminibacterium sp.]
MPTRYYIIAGEASGDLHGSNLIKALRQANPDASIRCWGGDLMEAAGATLVKHFRDLAFMGFWEVIKNLPVILRNLRFCKDDIEAFQPDVLVCIDYPGFNLRIAEWAHDKGCEQGANEQHQKKWNGNGAREIGHASRHPMKHLPRDATQQNPIKNREHPREVKCDSGLVRPEN